MYWQVQPRPTSSGCHFSVSDELHGSLLPLNNHDLQAWYHGRLKLLSFITAAFAGH
jgi:hypothetical protein